jgi:Ca2+-binding RTX toxin-like protein
MPQRDHSARTPAGLLVVALGAALLLAVSPGAAVGEGGVRCLGVPATLVGTAGDDQLVGTSGLDVIAGLAGSDVIEGLGGDDLLCGGAGFDDLAAGPGADTLEGGAHDDVMDGGPGVDTASYAGAPVRIVAGLSFTRGIGWGTDRLAHLENLVGSRFADQLGGDDRPNTIHGGPGNDKLFAMGGPDQVFGDEGDDFLDGGNGVDTMHGGTGANWCYLGERMRACRHT